jgi:hypothetical protein
MYMRRGAWLGLCVLAGCGRFGFQDEPGDDVSARRLTIEISGSGAGLVVGPGGIQCSETCTMDLPDTAVTLRGLAASESWLAGWSGPCGGNFDCVLPIDADDADVTVGVEFLPLPNRVFVTSDLYDGDLGGLAGADAICGDAATAGGLDGTFVAYLSSGGIDARSRLTGRGWIRTDGAPVVDVAAGFADGPVIFPIRLDEHGVDLGSVDFYTGTRAGAASGNDCAGWTSALATDVADLSWTSWGTTLAWNWDGGNACNEPRRLMCIETGRNVPVVTRPDTGRIAFLTPTGWAPGLGRASADAQCASDASDAGLEGTFLAALATTTDSIASRFAPGPPWRRMDDVRLLRGDGIFTTDLLDVAPEIDSAGQIVANDFWTGTRRWDAPSDTTEGSCADWTAVGGGVAAMNGHAGETSETDVTDSAKDVDCAGAYPLLCLQE